MDKKFSMFTEDAMQQYWLEPTATALSRLERIQASVTSMKPADTIDVQAVWRTPPAAPPRTPESSPTPEEATGESAGSGRTTPRSKPSPYAELETKPPLSSLNIQKTAWGSNSSIPDLIKAQAERQKQKTGGGGGGGAPRRPWSGKKVPPSPPPSNQRRTQSQASSGGDSTSREAKDSPFIAVQGSKSSMYDPGSRPSSGRPKPTSSSSSSSTVPHTDSCDVFEQVAAANVSRLPSGEDGGDQNNVLEEFLKNQPDGHRHELAKLSAAYADERVISPPPPPPCASPDLEKLVNGGIIENQDDVDEDSNEKHREVGSKARHQEIQAKQQTVPPQLLRRPTPEPLKLSMTLPQADGEEEYSTDGDSPLASPQLSPDLEVQSVTSEVFSQLHEHTSLENIPTHSALSRLSVTPQGGQTIAENRGDKGDDKEEGEDRREIRTRGRQSVHFVEEKNVTFDITPRNSISLRRPQPPPAPANRDRNQNQRPRSALKTSNREQPQTDSQSSRTDAVLKSSQISNAGTEKTSSHISRTNQENSAQIATPTPTTSTQKSRWNSANYSSVTARQRPKSGFARNADRARSSASTKSKRPTSEEEVATTDDDMDSSGYLGGILHKDTIDALNNNFYSDQQSSHSYNANRNPHSNDGNHQSMSGGRRRREVETMMSRLDISEDATVLQENVDERSSPRNDDPHRADILRTVQVSSKSASRQNYYEKAIQARKQRMYERQTAATVAARTLTTKVIEFGEEGPTMQTKDVAYFPAKTNKPSTSRTPRTGWEETSTHINRATIEKKTFVDHAPARPTSRMGTYEDKTEAEKADEILSKQAVVSRAMQRAHPRAAMLRAKQMAVVPHRCSGRKSPGSKLKQRPHSSHVNSLSPKKPARRRSVSPSAQPHSNSTKALVPTPTPFKSKAEMLRTRDAARALRDGSLKKNKVFGQQAAAATNTPVTGQLVKSTNPGKTDDGSDSDSIDEYPKSVMEEDVFNLHRHLTRNGVKVSYKTLKRGLVAPDERDLQQCVDQLPSNVSLNLLSKPQAWLGETYEKYRIADSALKRIDHQIAVEEEKARMEAEKLLASMRPTTKKKKRKKKVTKRKSKSSSASSASAAARSNLSSAMSTLNNLTGEMLKETRAASAPSTGRAEEEKLQIM